LYVTVLYIFMLHLSYIQHNGDISLENRQFSFSSVTIRK